MRLSYTAKESDVGRKVVHVLKRDLRLSGATISRLKKPGGVTVNGQSVYMDYPLAPGDAVEVDLLVTEKPPDFEPERGDIEILFESDWFVAVNKPMGMLVHPSRAQYGGTLAGFVAGYLMERYGVPVCHAVNRLDRDTSGVVLFSKSSHAKTLTLAAMRSGGEKVYVGYIFGALPGERGVIDAAIDRAEEGKMRRVVTPDGKRAVTDYEVLRVGNGISKVRFSLRTGRTHQIRVHCAYMGAPLIGDKIYRSEESGAFSDSHGFAGQLLHAELLTFRDPMTGADLSIRAPLRREDMARAEKLMTGSD